MSFSQVINELVAKVAVLMQLLSMECQMSFSGPYFLIMFEKWSEKLYRKYTKSLAPDFIFEPLNDQQDLYKCPKAKQKTAKRKSVR